MNGRASDPASTGNHRGLLIDLRAPAVPRIPVHMRFGEDHRP